MSLPLFTRSLTRHKRVLLLEDRRSLDEAVWLFNTVVCNASIEVLRAEVAGIREERRADRGRDATSQNKKRGIFCIHLLFLHTVREIFYTFNSISLMTRN